MEVKQVIVLRKDLNMRKGKMVAQGAHASLAAVLKCMDDNYKLTLTEAMKKWLDEVFTKVTVGCDSEAELLYLRDEAEESQIVHALIKDSGRTEFNGVHTYTALAIGPDEVSKINEITGDLKLL